MVEKQESSKPLRQMMVRVDEDVYVAVKVMAARQHRTMAEVISDLVRRAASNDQ